MGGVSSNPQTRTLEGLQSALQALTTRLRTEEKKFHLVQEIARALSSTLDLDRLLSLIMDKITVLMDAERSTLYLFTPDGRELWSKITGNLSMEIRLGLGEGIAGWVAASGEVVNIPDAYQDARFNADFDRQSGYRTRSILCMPMVNNLGSTIGVIQVLNKRGGPFTREDETLLAAMASQAAVSIDNSKLYHSVVEKNLELEETHRQLAQKTEDLNLLFEIEAEMNAALDLDGLLDRLLKRAMELVAAHAGSILLRERSTSDLYFRSVAGAAGEFLKRMRLPVGEGIAGWVAKERRPLIVNDPPSDPRHKAALALRIGYQPRSIICVPLNADEGEVLGVIELLDAANPSGFTEGDLKLLGLIAGQASKAIQLARAKEERQREERLASIGQMLSGVLHDLKTPMTIVSGYAQIMAQTDDAEERAGYVEQILRQFEHMSAMTREVLAFARGESNVLIRKVYLHQFLEDVRSYLTYAFADKQIELVIDARETGVAYFDELKFLRVVHNLARNAAQAMKPGGKFTMGISKVGSELEFQFSDTGPGIPPEMEGRLFELFATSGKKEGTGLGLAIVKKIVDEHHGTITYKSVPGEGTTFTIRMPAERQPGVRDTGQVPAFRPEARKTG